MRRLVACVVVLVVALMASGADAQRRESELALGVGFGGRDIRRTAEARTEARLSAGPLVELRFVRRVARGAGGSLQLGGRLGAGLGRQGTLARTEGAWRTTLDLGPILRWVGPGGAWAPTAALTGGVSFGVPSIPELYEGIGPGWGGHGGIWAGVRGAVGRLRLGAELGWMHHRLRSTRPTALRTMHQATLRLVVGFAGPAGGT